MLTDLINKIIERFLALSRNQKAAILIGVDIIFAVIALWVAFSLRLGFFYWPVNEIIYFFIAAPVIAVPVFIKLGLYRAIIRYIGIKALWTIIQATTLYALLFATCVFYSGVGSIPRTVPTLNWMIMLLLIGSSRFFARWLLRENYSRIINKQRGLDEGKKNVLIYGAGCAGVQLASALVHGHEFRAVAFIDDKPSLHKQKVNGLKIYPFNALEQLIERYKVSDVLLAMPSVKGARRSEIIRLLEPHSIHVRTIPDINEIARGQLTFDTIREVDVGDLLGRESVPPDETLLHANIRNKVVMVTGAGGSIGAELCKHILENQPRCLVLFEMSEFQLYSIEKELRTTYTTSCKIIPILGSITDKNRLEQVCNAFVIQTIYHTAAYKHVPLVEQNPAEAIWNNIFGTLTLAKVAIKFKVETFVLISTDKAVRPTNTMGATKRFAELILQALSQKPEDHQQTRFTMVRFGNVLGSSGSVVPLFREQIAKGGPVTVTDKRIIRYFMTIPEAAELVIQAGAMGQGGDVFVLDMGTPVQIVELARRMIHLSGFSVKDAAQPEGDIEIIYTGLRPGEKLYEELLIGTNVSQTQHEKIMRAEETIIPWEELSALLTTLEKIVSANDFEAVRQLLKQVVTGFNPQCAVADEVSLGLQRLESKTKNQKSHHAAM
ncbi:MAG: nucleoside-diphosphate sugar epimerase/dehydratase [Methylococcales bacterium]|nr:nucleoside-diphosphate sugar epimerase/dehydratase [Methylococcales bacterium]